ncbi:hypothetical protein L195_g055062 [Trifolium pratense]|uniref:Uncharacterized protein n=1 Tax=Trifolium pratense TaxID=57577 RepID=A0A2K3KJB8_TRIPR|nr:hypothetical protein L195_g055062 [Trifolium pratense]
MVLYHWSKGIKLNLPYVIIQHMIKTAQFGKNKIAIPYGMILTKIFKDFKVDLKKEHSENICHSFSVKNLHHMKKDDDEDDEATAVEVI